MGERKSKRVACREREREICTNNTKSGREREGERERNTYSKRVSATKR